MLYNLIITAFCLCIALILYLLYKLHTKTIENKTLYDKNIDYQHAMKECKDELIEYIKKIENLSSTIRFKEEFIKDYKKIIEDSV